MEGKAMWLVIQHNEGGRPCAWGLSQDEAAARAEATRQWDAHSCYPGECKGRETATTHSPREGRQETQSRLDATADAETLRLAADYWTGCPGWRAERVESALEDVDRAYDNVHRASIRCDIGDGAKVKVEALLLAHAAFRAVPGLR